MMLTFDSFIDSLLRAQEFKILGNVLIACILGLILGLVKELHSRPSGFRLNLVITISYALVGSLIFANKETINDGLVFVGVLISAGIISLGLFNNSRGEYSGNMAACISFFSAIIGYLIGMGNSLIAIIGTFMILLVLLISKGMEKKILAREYVLNVIVDSKTPLLRELLKLAEELKITLSSIDSKLVIFEQTECVKVRVEFVRGTSKNDINALVNSLKDDVEVKSISLRNDTYGVVR